MIRAAQEGDPKAMARVIERYKHIARSFAYGFVNNKNYNVADCEDMYHDSYDGAPSDGSAWVDEVSRNRLGRGGSFNYPAEGCRSAFRRFWYRPAIGGVGLGFRPAFSLPSED